MELSTIARQWSYRPKDQRYTSLEDLLIATTEGRNQSMEFTVPLAQVAKHLEIKGDNMNGELVLRGKDDTLPFTHWAFGQLSQRGGAPASYLRGLPTRITYTNMMWGLQHPPRGYDDKTKVLVRRGDHGYVKAFTSSTYGRIWDNDVVSAVIQAVTDSSWAVPSSIIGPRGTALYASDRDVFCFLIDPNRTIDVPGEPPMYRGFVVWNSETGAQTFGIRTFLYTSTGGRILWGDKEINSLLIRHTSGGPKRFAETAIPALKAYAESSVSTIVEGIVAAQEKKVGRTVDETIEYLTDRGFTVAAAKASIKAAELEGRDPTSLWSVVYGIARYVTGIDYQDTRFELEKKAGRLLEKVGG